MIPRIKCIHSRPYKQTNYRPSPIMLSANNGAPEMLAYDSHETEDGYIIFRHRASGQLQLQDPHLAAIMTQIGRECDRFAYATYRVAAKVTMLAQALHTSRIPYATITNIMERHRLRHTDNAPLVRAAQLTALLHDIFYAAEKMGLTNQPTTTASSSSTSKQMMPSFSTSAAFCLDDVVATAANLLWNIFDPDRIRPLSVLQLKQTFLLLCQPAAHHERLIHEHFLLAADHNGCVSRSRFESLVVVMSQLLRFVDPSAAAERFACEHIDGLLHGCFARCPGPMGLSKAQFYALWQRERHSDADAPFGAYAAVYATVVRMAEARDVLHLGVACMACGQLPVRGLLFRCVPCAAKQRSGVQMCFVCFASGATVTAPPDAAAGKHERAHRMEEITRSAALAASAPSRLHAFGHKLCTMFALCALNGKQRNAHGAAHQVDGDNVTMETHLMELGGIGQKCGRSEMRGDLGQPAEAKDASLGRKRTLTNQNNASWTSQCSRISGDSGEQQRRLSAVAAALSAEHERLLGWMEEQQRGSIRRRSCEFLHAHQRALADAVLELRKELRCNANKRGGDIGATNVAYCSTPHRASKKRSAVPLFAATPAGSTILRGRNDNNSHLAVSIRGADLNSSYLDASNMSDLSDLSAWYEARRSTIESLMRKRPLQRYDPSEVSDNEAAAHFEQDMTQFKRMLGIVKEIIDHSYADNAELSDVTGELERALDQISEAQTQRQIRMIQNTESIRV